jgi:hypothetical protein
MQEAELREKFRAFVEAIQSELADELYLVEKQPTKQILEYNRGNITWSDDYRLKFEKLFHQKHRTIRDLAEYSECIDFAMENYDVISEYHNNRRGLGEILISFAVDVFAENSRTLIFSDDEFDEIYPEYEKDLLTEEFPVRSFVPLHGLSYDGEVFELDANSRIRRVNKSDIELVTDFESPTGSSIPEDWDSASTHFLFEFDQIVEKTVNSAGCGDIGFEELGKAQDRIRSIITALRLAFSGDVGYSNHYDHSPCAWGGGLTTRRRTVRPLFFVGSMEIDDSEELKRHYNLLKSMDFESMEPNLKMSVERFNSSYIRESDRVAFADLMIVAEALCSGKNNISKNMLAQRLAIILGDDLDERQSYFSGFSDLYDERSGVWGVAHGGGKTTLGEEALETAQRYVKELLMFFLNNVEHYGGHGAILKELEMEIEQNHLEVEFPKSS